MKVTIESTDNYLLVDGVPCRIWMGKSEKGDPFVAYVYRSVFTDLNAKAEFDGELRGVANHYYVPDAQLEQKEKEADS